MVNFMLLTGASWFEVRLHKQVFITVRIARRAMVNELSGLARITFKEHAGPRSKARVQCDLLVEEIIDFALRSDVVSLKPRITSNIWL